MVRDGWIVYENNCIIKILMMGAFIVLSCASIIWFINNLVCMHSVEEDGEISQINNFDNCHTVVGKGSLLYHTKFRSDSLSLSLPFLSTVHLWALSMLKTKTKMVFYTWLTVERTLLDIKVPSPEMLLTRMHTYTMSCILQQ